ncbi:MAG: phasin family protein [Steroidobacteraceae bacterium]
MTSQIMDAQRKLWEVGASALARGSKLGGPISPGALAESLQGGMKKLEEVFDQRVLNSLSHAGMPSPQELRELMERVDSLSAKVERLSRARPTKRTKR